MSDHDLIIKLLNNPFLHNTTARERRAAVSGGRYAPNTFYTYLVKTGQLPL